MTLAARRSALAAAAVVACLTLLGGCFLLPETHSSSHSSDSKSSHDDADDDSADDGDSTAAPDDSDAVAAPELSAMDLASLELPATVDGLPLTADSQSFTVASSYEQLLADWQSSGNPVDGCFAADAASGALSVDDADSADQAISIAYVDNDYRDGRLGVVGRVLDPTEDAKALLSEFADAAHDCTDGFQVQRGDGLWDVSRVTYTRARFEVPKSVAAFILDYRMAGDGPTAFRTSFLQRGNVVIAVFAIVQPTSAFDADSITPLSESLAASLADLG